MKGFSIPNQVIWLYFSKKQFGWPKQGSCQEGTGFRKPSVLAASTMSLFQSQSHRVYHTTEAVPAAPSGFGWDNSAGFLSASIVQMLNHRFEIVKVNWLGTGVTDVNPHPACSSDSQTAANISTWFAFIFLRVLAPVVLG